jgi:hypothetical protein
MRYVRQFMKARPRGIRGRLRRTVRTVLIGNCLVCGASGQNFFPLRDVHRGLHGVGKTVFEGNRVEEFQVEILGVLQNSAPGQSIILARLSGGPLAEAGVIQGMSGSPVYIDGKLLGAVALGFPYSKQPIAGIQPIEQMVADAQVSGTQARNRKSSSPAQLEPVSFQGMWAKLPGRSEPGQLTALLTPLAVSGLTASTVEHFSAEFRKLGFEPQQGVSSGLPVSQDFSGTVAPGSMISVGLLSGDMSVSADGTVTYVDGKRLYAFGHRFLDIGSAEMPFARSEVITILPNVNTSFKLSSPKQWVGTITSDRSTAIAGEIGRPAHTIPLHIAVHSKGAPAHEYKMQVVNDRLLTPFLTQTALFSAIDATERTVGAGTLKMSARIEFDGGLAPLVMQDSFVSDSGLAQQAASNSVVPLAFLFSAGFQSTHVKGMTFDLQPSEVKRQLYIAQAWTSAHSVRPGEIVSVSFALTGENGASETRSVDYRVPIGAPSGVLNFTVSDAATLNWPDFGGMNAGSAKTAQDLIRLLDQYRGSEAAYVRVWRPEPSFTISGPAPGGELTDPPPSVMLILADPSSSPTANTAQVATRGSGVSELIVPMSGTVISGARTVQVEVKE